MATKPAKSGYAPVNGLKMYYEIHGKGKPIVLLHGSYMTIDLNWGKLIPFLAKNRQVIAVELQGHGRTADIDRPISYEGMADDVSALLAYLKIDQADVFGYSLGAGVALQTAIRHPQQVGKLIVASGTYQHKGWHPDAFALFPALTAETFKGSPLEKQYDSLAPDPTRWPALIRKVATMHSKTFDWQAATIRNIKSPMFIIVGDADGVTHEHALDMFRLKGGGEFGDISGLSDSRLAILPATTHTGLLERADWLLPMVNEFLDSAPPTPNSKDTLVKTDK